MKSALRFQANDPETNSDVADVQAMRGQTAEAEIHYRSAIQLNPETHAAHLGLGLILARKCRPAEARAHLMKAAERANPDVREAARRALPQ